jgi:hypothetical protein
MDKPHGGSVRTQAGGSATDLSLNVPGSGPATSACSFRTPTCSRDIGSPKAVSALSAGEYHGDAIDE